MFKINTYDMPNCTNAKEILQEALISVIEIQQKPNAISKGTEE
jgi:hypothetical protein